MTKSCGTTWESWVSWANCEYGWSFFPGVETGVGRVASVVSSTFVELWYSSSTQERECFSLVGL